jgi:hypothetical protein
MDMCMLRKWGEALRTEMETPRRRATNTVLDELQLLIITGACIEDGSSEHHKDAVILTLENISLPNFCTIAWCSVLYPCSYLAVKRQQLRGPQS